jgi:prevent-host-death family protein
MKRVSFTEFRRHASGLLSRVQEGETLVVLRHGRPIAEINPVSEDEVKTPSWKRPGVRLVAKGARLSTAILEGRKREGIL